ncbi:hypothetical protein [Fimbriiglobus ruber]|uniref:Uncharacterized protein n=1 Tax=Fimbriiglobus ruber TaxID=1908690 RepID=A0A225D187_9BACT|nr:hypothetical protein [Fimbriiglobus ruber]OWK35351.1 hypothetical protein FRUB_09512 [Fimbriiglobus ruber]
MPRPLRPFVSALALAALAVGCGGGSSAPARPLPPGYVAFHRDGQFVPTGNPTLDYWVRVNMIRHFSDRPARPWPDMEHGLAGVIRAADPAGVDPDLVAWAGTVADYLDGRADLDPRTPGGRPDPVAADPAVQKSLAAARADIANRGDALRESLTRRHGRLFPPCLW